MGVCRFVSKQKHESFALIVLLTLLFSFSYAGEAHAHKTKSSIIRLETCSPAECRWTERARNFRKGVDPFSNIIVFNEGGDDFAPPPELGPWLTCEQFHHEKKEKRYSNKLSFTDIVDTLQALDSLHYIKNISSGSFASLAKGSVAKSFPEIEESQKSLIDLKHDLLIMASKLESGIDSHYLLARASLIERDWNECWRQGEIVFRNAHDDAGQIKRMMELYQHQPGRYLEYCIWITRFLRVAPDWESFQTAYYERWRIEFISSQDHYDGDDDKAVDAPIAQVQIPLRFYFVRTADDLQALDQESIFRCCAEQFEQWTVASGFKLHFLEVERAEDADIIFEIKTPQRPYSVNTSPNHAPSGFPFMPRLGETQTSYDQKGRAHNRITIFIENASDQDDDKLVNICLHEIGHALGLKKHTLGKGDVMDRYCASPALNQLSHQDCERMKKLYKDAPISLDAIAQLSLKTKAWGI